MKLSKTSVESFNLSPVFLFYVAVAGSVSLSDPTPRYTAPEGVFGYGKSSVPTQRTHQAPETVVPLTRDFVRESRDNFSFVCCPNYGRTRFQSVCLRQSIRTPCRGPAWSWASIDRCCIPGVSSSFSSHCRIL